MNLIAVYKNTLGTKIASYSDIYIGSTKPTFRSFLNIFLHILKYVFCFTTVGSKWLVSEKFIAEMFE